MIWKILGILYIANHLVGIIGTTLALLCNKFGKSIRKGSAFTTIIVILLILYGGIPLLICFIWEKITKKSVNDLF